ncbi:MAG TPA: protein kinase [Pyrinomonadaceae bacterium]|nr:protein kinase [Pyrinomonadaceae bacterium]
MQSLSRYVGQILDEKYRLERLLGSGGMGAVYLASHLGTERYVALKIIAPEFMRNVEFVERFKREARAAGGLRHPNVVDVTDFGFAEAGGEKVAYLVMEYLDGCTLGDVLAEEKKLPLEWVVDILEQVCSAVHEAHQQAIVHRDLKPDNIWLEPNRLGGYRVKVLDFGIAKLGETQMTAETAGLPPIDGRRMSAAATGSAHPRATQLVADDAATAIMEAEPATAIMEAPANEDGDRTLLFDQPTHHVTNPAATKTTELTRIGAIMGTPAYMSPEQCAAKSLDARSDIYSLGVIAYQMLSGETPFAGHTGSVIREHMELPPKPLRERNKKVPRRVAETVMSTLAKNPAERPQTALAFANSLRAQAQSIGSLYRRAFALFSEHFPTFLKLSLTVHLPFIVTTITLVILQLAEDAQPQGWGTTKIVLVVAMVCVGLLHVVVQFLAATTISGVTAVIVTQLAAAPLRPVKLHDAIGVLKRRWRPFLRTAMRVTILVVIGYALVIIPGIVMTIRYALWAPVVLLEGLKGKAATRRAVELARRSWRTVIIVVLLQFLIPMAIGSLVGEVSVGITVNDGSPRQPRNKIYQQLTSLVNILIVPLMSIVPALLYLKMRQLGGESFGNLLDEIEVVDQRQTQWQQRMRSRLSSSRPRREKSADYAD